MFACLPYFLHWFHALLSCFFLPNCSLLHCFVVCRFFSVPLARFGQLAFILNSFFLWCRLCLMFFPLCLICFTLLLSFSCSFLARFVIAFFCYANDLDTSISAYSFSFFLASLFAFWRSNIENTHHSAPQTSYFPSSPPPMILFDHHAHPCALPGFLCCVHALQNIPCSPIYCSFYLVFAFPPCPHTPPHPSEPIYIHPRPFTPHFAKLAKTWCPGKFPRP